MIGIPIWVFVILVALASITALFLILVLAGAIASMFDKPKESRSDKCPYEIEC